MPNIFRQKEHECVACGYVMNALAAVPGGPGDGEPAREGDTAICLGCGAIFTFNADMKLVLAPDEKAKTDPEFETAREAQRRIRKMRGLPV